MLKTKLRETSAGGVVFHGQRVLILRRKSGEWVMPKGKLEQGEDPADAALREVEEESGLSATVVEPLGITRYEYTASSNDPIYKTVRWFLMKCQEGDLEVGSTFREGRFAQPEEAFELLTFDSDREVLREALARLRRKQETLSRRAARLLNSISVPGVAPMTWQEKPFIFSVIGLGLAFLIVLMVLSGNWP